MSQPTASIVDALSGEEVCPLCFDRYSGADACTCVVCSAVSCPSCAELLDIVDARRSARAPSADGAVRCFACRPALVTVAAANLGTGPLSLPRPIAVPSAAREQAVARAASGLLPPPFPLTTSPLGVRSLRPHPAGSVFVGLPPVSPGLSGVLSAASAAPRSDLLKLGARAQRKLALLFSFVSLVRRLSERGRALSALTNERALLLRARLPGQRERMLSGLALLRKELRALLTRSFARPKAAGVDPSRPIHS